MTEFEQLARQGYNRCALINIAGGDCDCPNCWYPERDGPAEITEIATFPAAPEIPF